MLKTSRVSTQRMQQTELTYPVDALGSVSHVPQTETELKPSSVVVNALNKNFCRNLRYLRFTTISFLATSYIVHVISSTNYFRQSPQLQKATTSRPRKHNRLLPDRRGSRKNIWGPGPLNFPSPPFFPTPSPCPPKLSLPSCPPSPPSLPLSPSLPFLFFLSLPSPPYPPFLPLPLEVGPRKSS